jgi:hypothetical protein
MASVPPRTSQSRQNKGQSNGSVALTILLILIACVGVGYFAYKETPDEAQGVRYFVAGNAAAQKSCTDNIANGAEGSEIITIGQKFWAYEDSETLCEVNSVDDFKASWTEAEMEKATHELVVVTRGGVVGIGGESADVFRIKTAKKGQDKKRQDAKAAQP